MAARTMRLLGPLFALSFPLAGLSFAWVLTEGCDQNGFGCLGLSVIAALGALTGAPLVVVVAQAPGVGEGVGVALGIGLSLAVWALIGGALARRTINRARSAPRLLPLLRGFLWRYAVVVLAWTAIFSLILPVLLARSLR
jgi:hypothetical protein